MSVCKPVPVHRPAPHLSRKRRNRLIKALNGNTTPTPFCTRKRRQFSGLNHPKISDRENMSPSNKRRKLTPTSRGKGNKNVRHKRPSQPSSDGEYQPPAQERRRLHRPTPTPNREPMPHAKLLQLQIDRGFSDRDIFAITAAYRDHAEHVPKFIPYRKQIRMRLHKYFTAKKFLHLPSVFCNDVLGLLRELEEIHDRKIIRVHIGCDDGGGSLKIMLSPIFASAESCTDSDTCSDSDSATDSDTNSDAKSKSNIPDTGMEKAVVFQCDRE